jgi:hypothetical protein
VPSYDDPLLQDDPQEKSMLRNSLAHLAVLAVAATAVGISAAPAFAHEYPEKPAPCCQSHGDDNGDDD